MKRVFALALALALALSLCACGKKDTDAAPQNAAENGTVQQQEEPKTAEAAAEPEKPETRWYYQAYTKTDERELKAEDGTQLGSVSHQLIYLTLVNDGPETEPPAEMQAIRDTYNAAMDATFAEWSEVDAEEMAREDYAWAQESGYEFMLHSDEFSVSDAYQTATLVSVVGGRSEFGSVAHANNYLMSWNYDLERGEFISLNDLTDDPLTLRGYLAWEIIDQIYEREETDWYYDDYMDTIEHTEDFHFWFDADGLYIWFPEYDIAPHAAGIPMFDIPYSRIAQFLNERGERLLELSLEDRMYGDFFEAEDMWSWFDGCAPAGEGSISVPNAEYGWDDIYNRVDVPGVNSIADLRAKLSTRFSDELVERMFSERGEVFREQDGALYCLPAGRGDDMTIADVDFKLTLNDTQTGGVMTVTITRQDYDDKTDAWQLTGEVDTLEMPFEITEQGARFTDFHSVW